MSLVSLHSAHSARFFKDFDVLAAENPIFSLASHRVETQETEGLGLRVISYFLSVRLEGSGS